MAIARVKQIDTVNETTSGGGNDITVVIPGGGVASGNHLLMALALDNATPTFDSITDSKGNSYAVDVSQSNVGQAASVHILSGYVASALTSSDTVTVSFSGFNNVVGVVVEFSGLSSASYLDKTTGANTAWGTDHSSGATSTTAQDDELLIGAHAFVQLGLTWAPAGSWNEEHDAYGGNGRLLAAQYQIVAAAGAYESNGTLSGSSDGTNAIATYKSGVGAVAPTLRTVRSSLRWG